MDRFTHKLSREERVAQWKSDAVTFAGPVPNTITEDPGGPLAFNVEGSKRKGVSVIKITNTSGETVFDFIDYFKDQNIKFYFDRSNDFGFTMGKDGVGQVHIPRHIGSPREIFSVLHEIGHAIDHRKNPELNERAAEVTDSYSDMKESNGNPVLQIERNAWAEAIRLGRAISKEKGVDFFKLFSSADEFMGYVRIFLRTYEMHTVDDPLGEKLTKEEQFTTALIGLWDDLSKKEKSAIYDMEEYEEYTGKKILPNGFSTFD